jgi:ubiquinone/menaquinone biosynthesis C-methylase UbiE
MIVMLRTANAEQEQSWNSNSGQAWIALQDTLDAMFKPFQDLLAEKVRIASSRQQHVLDVGCGTGATTLDMAERLGDRGSCTGNDFSGPMMAPHDHAPTLVTCQWNSLSPTHKHIHSLTSASTLSCLASA